MWATTRTSRRTSSLWLIGITVAMVFPLAPALATEGAVAEAGDPVADAAAETEGDAQSSADAQARSDARLDALEAKVDIVAEELSKAITTATVPEEKELTSYGGLGPAASKVYYRDKGLSIGGYGEFLLSTAVTDENDGKGGKVAKDSVFDSLRAVLYVGYKFNDQWVVNTELEFEHGGTSGGGSVSAEFVTIDYMPRDWLNVRVGLVLIPMGFINEVHEPTFFFGANRPAVERLIIPSTWRENGAGLFGSIGGRFRYRMYAVNGMDASGFSVAGIRGGRQKGSRALSNNWAFVGRFDVDVINGLVMGGSVYAGKSGQGQLGCGPTCNTATPVMATPIPGTPTTLYELHAAFERWGLTVKALWAQTFIGDAGALNFALGNAPAGGKAVARQMLGWYAEAGYDVLPLVLVDTRMSLEPYFRYERLDTQNVMPAGYVRNSKFVQDIYTVGLQFKPIPQIAFKLDYQNIRPESNPDDEANLVRFAAAYVF